MTRAIPGTIKVEGREFLYMEIAEGENFRQLLDGALALCANIPMPQSGGVVEEKVHISLKDGSSMLAVSYKGDVLGWRRKLTALCESKGRKWGIASNQRIILSNGAEIDLSISDVTFEE